MKEYKTYQARNAVKAALVTNHIKARKKQGVSHLDAKIEAYVKYDIKKGKIILKRALARELGSFAASASSSTGKASTTNARLVQVFGVATSTTLTKHRGIKKQHFAP